MILTGSLPLGMSKDSMNLGMLTGATSCQPTPPAQIPKGHSAGKLSKFSTLFPSSTLWLLMLLTHFVPPPFQINSHHVARGDERFTEQATVGF